MLVPSTFTGWYRNTIMTKAKPMAIKRSRVHTRTSLRSELELCPSDDGRDDESSALAASVPHEHDEDAGASGTVLLASWSCLVLSIGRPRIYSMAVAACARFVLRFAACGNRSGGILRHLGKIRSLGFSVA